MPPNNPTGASKKRKRSDSPEDQAERERTSSIVRRSIALLTAIPNSELPHASFSPLLRTLNDAYHSALLDEPTAAASPAHAQRLEDWNWDLSAHQIAELSEEEWTIWKDMLVCRHSLHLALRASHSNGGQGIKFHPREWNLPGVNLRQWVAHIPGLPNTPWEGGVYSLEVSFPPGLPEEVPKFRFIVPLFHPNVLPSGTWRHTFVENAIIVLGKTKNHFPCTWKKTTQEDPLRFAKLLNSIQKSLNEPTINDPAQYDAYTIAKNDPDAYEARVRAEAEAWKPDPRTGLAGRPILQHVQEEES
ncbi:ubiquitin-conjugating enzyme/RWD-like protein [Mycena galericulata]|nr:ubiquitin-conjugating enzyme/RWD-like protein [Mycena galericulata]